MFGVYAWLVKPDYIIAINSTGSIMHTYTPEAGAQPCRVGVLVQADTNSSSSTPGRQPFFVADCPLRDPYASGPYSSRICRITGDLKLLNDSKVSFYVWHFSVVSGPAGS